MSSIRQFLSYSIIAVLGTAPLQAQTIRSATEFGATMAGFGTAIVIGDGEILVSRTGVALMLPLLPSRIGGIHVFRPDAGTGVWEEAAHLTASDGDFGDGFGTAMAVDGNTLIVGAPGKDEGRGAVYLFHREQSGNWSQAGVLSAGDGVAGDSLGAALSPCTCSCAGTPGGRSRRSLREATHSPKTGSGWRCLSTAIGR